MNLPTFAGQFLVATPIITLPPFARSVVFLLEHDESGAVGVVLNLPTDLLVRDHLPDIGAKLSEPPFVFYGGPVNSDTAIALGQGSDLDFIRPSAVANIGIVDIEEPLAGLDKLRVFAGYSGWDPSQLEAELAEEAWWPLVANLTDVFADDVSRMWERTVERAPGNIPLYATYPFDPSEN